MSKWRLEDDTVNPAGVVPQIWAPIDLATSIWAETGAELVVTSLNDGRHRATSLHFAGAAVDLRTKTIGTEAAKHAPVSELHSRLGSHHDVGLEALGTANEHCYVEFQPRWPTA